MPKFSAKFEQVTPNGGIKCRWVDDLRNSKMLKDKCTLSVKIE